MELEYVPYAVECVGLVNQVVVPDKDYVGPAVFYRVVAVGREPFAVEAEYFDICAGADGRRYLRAAVVLPRHDVAYPLAGREEEPLNAPNPFRRVGRYGYLQSQSLSHILREDSEKPGQSLKILNKMETGGRKVGEFVVTL